MNASFLREVPSWFRSTREGRKMIAEAEATAEADRAALIAELAAVAEQEARVLPPFQDRLAAAEEQEGLAFDALRRRADARAATATALRGERFALERRRTEAQIKLRKSADP